MVGLNFDSYKFHTSQNYPPKRDKQGNSKMLHCELGEHMPAVTAVYP